MTAGRFVGSRAFMRMSGLFFGICTLAPCTSAKDISSGAADAPSEIGALWDQTLASGDRSKIMASYDVVNDLHDGVQPPTSEECRAKSAALDEAMRVNPVGLGVWYVAYLCAEQLGDANSARDRLKRFTGLIQYAVNTLPPDHGATPMRVVSPIDVEAFIVASGQKVLHKEYNFLHSERQLPLRVIMWDPQTSHERWLAFDYLDTFVRLSRKEPAFQAPALRRNLALSILKNFSENDSAAKAALELSEAKKIVDDHARIAKLIELASAKNFSAAIFLASICSSGRELHCEGQAIDALLPFVEKKDATAMLALAVFYAEGIGVKRDDDAARKLLATVDERLGNGMGTLLFGMRRFDRSQTVLPELVRKDVEALAKRGDALAEMMVAAAALAQRKPTDAPKDIPNWVTSQLKDAASKRLPLAQGGLAFVLAAQGKIDEALPLMQQAAEGNFAAAEAYLASIYERGWPEKRFSRDPDQALYWHTQAGADGDVPSMLWLGRHYRDQPDNESIRAAARAWFRSADTHGSTEGALGLAAMFRDRRGDEEGNPASALAIYRWLSEKRNSAEARRAWAGMVRDGNGTEKNLGEARRLLSSDAEKGDAQSQYELGALLLSDTEIKDVNDGLGWMRKSAEQGNSAAIYWMGWEYEYGKHLAADNAKAIANYRAAVDKGNTDGMVQLAAMANEGRGMAADKTLGIKLLKDAAERGSTKGMNRLAWALFEGSGVPADQVAGENWFRKSAQLGDREGMRGLGYALLYREQSPSFKDGMEWLTRSAQAGNALAMNNLAAAYRTGKVVAKDMHQYEEWLQRAGDAGDTDSMNSLGWYYEHDDAGAANAVKAAAWYRRGSDAGNLDAINNYARQLAAGLGVPKDVVEAKRLYEVAVARGSHHAKCNLGMMLASEKEAQARSWSLLVESADAGNQICQLTVGLAYHYGDDPEHKGNIEKAKHYLELASSQGDDEARADLADIILQTQETDAASVANERKTLETLAVKGVARAQVLLGSECVLGRSGPVDLPCARKWYEKVARQETQFKPFASSQLGEMLIAGNGGSVDRVAAERWIRIAIAGNSVRGPYDLGTLLLREGRAPEALELLDKSATNRNLAAAYRIQRYCKEKPGCALSKSRQKEIDSAIDNIPNKSKNNTAWVIAIDPLSDVEDGRFAVRLIESMEKGTNTDASVLDTLAASQARAGEFEAAQRTQEQALEKLDADTPPSARRRMDDRRKRYAASLPWNGPD